jgi:hypothetical protein
MWHNSVVDTRPGSNEHNDLIYGPIRDNASGGRTRQAIVGEKSASMVIRLFDDIGELEGLDETAVWTRIPREIRSQIVGMGTFVHGGGWNARSMAQKWFQAVYRTTDDDNDILTVWMTEPYGMSAFQAVHLNETLGYPEGAVEYQYSRVRKTIRGDLDMLNHEFGGRFYCTAHRGASPEQRRTMIDASGIYRFLATPAQLPGNWQSNTNQTGFNGDGRNRGGSLMSRGQTLMAFDMNTRAIFNGMDEIHMTSGAPGDHFRAGTNDTMHDYIWLPSMFETFYTGMEHNRFDEVGQYSWVRPPAGHTTGEYGAEAIGEPGMVAGQRGGGASSILTPRQDSLHRHGLWQLNGFDRATRAPVSNSGMHILDRYHFRNLVGDTALSGSRIAMGYKNGGIEPSRGGDVYADGGSISGVIPSHVAQTPYVGMRPAMHIDLNQIRLALAGGLGTNRVDVTTGFTGGGAGHGIYAPGLLEASGVQRHSQIMGSAMFYNNVLAIEYVAGDTVEMGRYMIDGISINNQRLEVGVGWREIEIEYIHKYIDDRGFPQQDVRTKLAEYRATYNETVGIGIMPLARTRLVLELRNAEDSAMLIMAHMTPHHFIHTYHNTHNIGQQAAVGRQFIGVDFRISNAVYNFPGHKHIGWTDRVNTFVSSYTYNPVTGEYSNVDVRTHGVIGPSAFYQFGQVANAFRRDMDFYPVYVRSVGNVMITGSHVESGSIGGATIGAYFPHLSMTWDFDLSLPSSMLLPDATKMNTFTDGTIEFVGFYIINDGVVVHLTPDEQGRFFVPFTPLGLNALGMMHVGTASSAINANINVTVHTIWRLVDAPDVPDDADDEEDDD